MKHTERAAIDELALLLDGELPAGEAAAPLRRLATLAVTIAETETVERPTPAVRAALRNQLVAEIEASKMTPLGRVRDAVWHRTAGVRHSARMAVATAVASTMLGSAGVAAAAQHALPGDALYGVKRVTESVRLSLASGLREEGHVHLTLAEERLEELRDGVDRLDTDEVVDTLDRMDAASLSASAAFIQAVTEGDDATILEELVTFTDRQRAGLIEVYDHLPADARPFADASLEVLRRIDVEVASTVGPCAVCEQIASGATVTSVTPGDAITGRGCDCIPADVPPPPRDPGAIVPPTAPAVGAGTPAPEEPSDTTSDDGDGRTIVPPLPGPLDGIGEAVDDVVEDLLDTPAPLVSPLPTDPTDATEPVEEVVDDLGGLLESTQP